MITGNKKIMTDMHVLLGIIALLIVIGGLFIYSSSSVYALTTFGFSHYFLKKYIFGVVLGFLGLLGVLFIPLSCIKKISPYFFIFTLLLTMLTLFPQYASRIHGSSRWIRLFGISFQPSEFLKIGLLLYISYFLDKKINNQESCIDTFIPLCIILAIPGFILLKQPDFGFTVTLISSILIICFIAQFQIKPILVSFLGLIPLVIGLIVYRPYRMKRISIFLNPWHDPQGSGFQIIQSLIAIGSGGWCGIGIGQSKQKFFYLPMQHTDFIFSIIAEEVGFIGVLGLILLYVLFLYFGLRIACDIKNRFSQFFILNFIILVSLQAIINLLVTTGMAPTKGIGLPFVSYGNTGLITYLIMVGLLINMVKEDCRKESFFY